MENAEQIESLWHELHDKQLLAIDMGRFLETCQLNCIMCDCLTRWIKIYFSANDTSKNNSSSSKLSKSTERRNLDQILSIDESVKTIVMNVIELLRFNSIIYYAYDEVNKFVEDRVTCSHLNNWPLHQLKILFNKCLYLLRMSNSHYANDDTKYEMAKICSQSRSQLPAFISSILNPIRNKATIRYMTDLTFVKIARGISLANIYRCLIEMSIFAGHKNLSILLHRIVVKSIHFDSCEFKSRLFNEDSIIYNLEAMIHDEEESDDDDEELSVGADSQYADDEADSQNLHTHLVSSKRNPSDSFSVKHRKKCLAEHIEESCFKFLCRLCSHLTTFSMSINDQCTNCQQNIYFCSFSFEPIDIVDLSFDFDINQVKDILKQNVRLHLRNLTKSLPESVKSKALSAKMNQPDESTNYYPTNKAKTLTETTINAKSGKLVEKMTLTMHSDSNNDDDVDKNDTNDYSSLVQYEPTDYIEDDRLEPIEELLRQYYTLDFQYKEEQKESTESFSLLSYYLFETSVTKTNAPEHIDRKTCFKTILKAPLNITKDNLNTIKLINYNDLIILEPPALENSTRISGFTTAHQEKVFLKTRNFVSIYWCSLGCQAIFDRKVVEILNSDPRLSILSESSELVYQNDLIPCPICQSNLILLE